MIKIGTKKVTKMVINNKEVLKVVVNGNVKYQKGSSGTTVTFTPDIGNAGYTSGNNKYWGTRFSPNYLSSTLSLTLYDYLLYLYNNINGTSYTSISNVKLDEVNVTLGGSWWSTIYGFQMGMAVGTSGSVMANAANWQQVNPIMQLSTGVTTTTTTQVQNLNLTITDFTLATSSTRHLSPYFVCAYYTNDTHTSSSYNTTSTSATAPSAVVINSLTFKFDVA